jgi:hypothetical protein
LEETRIGHYWDLVALMEKHIIFRRIIKISVYYLVGFCLVAEESLMMMMMMKCGLNKHFLYKWLVFYYEWKLQLQLQIVATFKAEGFVDSAATAATTSC